MDAAPTRTAAAARITLEVIGLSAAMALVDAALTITPILWLIDPTGYGRAFSWLALCYAGPVLAAVALLRSRAKVASVAAGGLVLVRGGFWAYITSSVDRDIAEALPWVAFALLLGTGVTMGVAGWLVAHSDWPARVMRWVGAGGLLAASISFLLAPPLPAAARATELARAQGRLGRAGRATQHPDADHRHRAARPSRRLRVQEGQDAEHRRDRALGRSLSRSHRPGADHPPLPRLDPHRALSGQPPDARLQSAPRRGPPRGAPRRAAGQCGLQHGGRHRLRSPLARGRAGSGLRRLSVHRAAGRVRLRADQHGLRSLGPRPPRAAAQQPPLPARARDRRGRDPLDRSLRRRSLLPLAALLRRPRSLPGIERVRCPHAPSRGRPARAVHAHLLLRQRDRGAWTLSSVD